MEQKKEAPAAEPEATQNTGADTVTEPKATIKIEGQEFELDAALAQEDKTLKVALQPHFASIESANITRDVKDGKLTVTIVKRAQHKGAR
jgi:LAS superfamily LD-carboxypeptidase LdcB